MSDFSQIQHPIIKSELAFQDFCLKLIRRYWGDDYAALHGRRGEKQDGIDIRGHDKRNGYSNAGMQCKGSESHEPRELSELEIEQEVDKARKLKPSLDILVIAYAGKRSAPLQNKAKALNDENTAQGLFKVVLWPWDEIVTRAGDFPEIAEALLAENKFVTPVNALTPKRPSSDPVSSSTAAMTKLQTALAELQASMNEGAQDDQHDPVAQAKLDVWRDQIQSGNGSLAVKGLRDFIARMPEGTSPAIRLRAYRMLSAALIQADELESAAIACDEGAAAQPESADGYALTARAFLLRQQPDAAFKAAAIAIKKDGANPFAAPIFIETAPKNYPAADLEAKVAIALHHADVRTALCRRFMAEGANDDALRVARAIDENDKNWTRSIAIGEAILSSFDSDMRLRIGAPQDAEVGALLAEAAHHLEKAWTYIKTRGDYHNWVHVAGNLGVAYRLAGQLNRAAQIALEAHALCPDERIIKEQVVIAYMHQGNLVEATRVANEIAADGTPDDQLLAASVAAASKDWRKAGVWSRAAYDAFNVPDKKARAAELMVLADYKQRNAVSALALAHSLRGDFSPSVAFEARVAEIARRSEDLAEIESAKGRIAAFDPKELNAIESFELSEAYADQGEWSAAADLLDGLHTVDRVSEPLIRHLNALHRAKRRSEGRKLFEALKGEPLRSKEVLRLGAAIYEASGMLPDAIAALNKATTLDARDLRSRLDWARLCLRDGRERELSKWVKKAPLDFEAAADDMLELAQLLDRYGERKKALRLGYTTLRKNWGVSESLHMRYMSLFLLRGARRERLLSPKSVAEDVVVTLKNSLGGSTQYLLSNEDNDLNALSTKHPFAQKLMGAEPGAKVVNAPAIGQPQEWEVVELKHKYVDLFQKAMQEHSTLFPGSRALGSFHIEPEKENGFEPVFEQVRDRARRAQDATRLYTEQPIPIDVVARMLGIDAIDAFAGLRFQLDTRIDNCIGSLDEREDVLQQLRDTAAVMPDLLTLDLWNDIGLLPLLQAQNAVSVQVVQAIRDALKERLEDAKMAIAGGGGSLQARGDKVQLIERSKEQKEAEARRRADLGAWVEKHTIIVPTEAPRFSDDSIVSDVLSRETVDAIATATAGKITLISEDRRIRSLAHSMGLKAASWTQPLLHLLLERGAITHSQYVVMLAKLQRHRVGFVSIGHDDLQRATDDGTWEDLTTLTEALCAPRVDPPGLHQIARQFIMTLWREEQYASVKLRLTSALLSTLVVGRSDGLKLARTIIVGVADDIRKLPRPLHMLSKPWGDYVEAFLRGHFIRGAILL